MPESVTVIDSLDNLSNLDDYDAVINLAGEAIVDKRWSNKQKNIICESRWQTTQTLVDLFARSQKPPKVFLSGSAIGIYGNRNNVVLTESTTIQADDFASQLCQRWEDIAKKAESYTRVMYLRTGIVLTTEGGALAKMLLPFKFGLGGRMGNGQQYMPWIHVQDYIDALNYLLIQHELSQAVNLVAPEAVTNQVLTQTLAGTLHRPAILPMPKLLLKMLLGESSSLLLDSQRVSPKKLLDHGFSFSFPNLQAALNDLLAAPKDLKG